MTGKDQHVNKNIVHFVKYAPIALAMFDRHMRYLAVSKRWLLDFCLRDEDIIGRSHYDIFPEIPDRWKIVSQRVLAGRVEQSQEDSFEREDGTLQWLRWDLLPWHEADGSIGGVLIFIEDITEKKKALERQQESEAKYRSLFESMSVGFALHEIITDEEGIPCDFRFLEMNAACESLTGLNRSEIIGRCVREFLPESNWIARYGKVVLTGKPEHFEDYSTTLQRWFEVFAYRPKPYQCAAIFTDITKGKMTEGALKKSEGQLRTLIRTIPDLVWLKDQQGIYLFCNSRFENFYGAKEKDIIGKTDYDFVNSKLADFFREHDALAIAKGIPSKNEEEVVFADDGHPAVLETIKTPMYTSDGQLIGVLGIGREITNHKRTEEALRYQEFLLNQMGEIARIGGWGFDPATGEGTWTKEVARIHDLDPDEETSVEKGLNFYQGESRLKIEKAIKEATELGRSYDEELELVTAKGTHKWVRTIGVPVVEKGQVVRINGSIQDITEIKEDRERIQHLNNILRAIRDVNQLISQEKDAHNLIQKCCQQMVEDRGYHSAMIILTDEQDHPFSWAKAGLAASSKSMNSMLERGEIPSCCSRTSSVKEAVVLTNYKEDVCVSCPIGDDVSFPVGTQSLCVKMVYEDMSFGYLVASLKHDLSMDTEATSLFREMAGNLAYALNVLRMDEAHKNSERRSKSLERQLFQAQKMEAVGQLAGGVAHDYNNMLGVIIGYAELAMDKAGPATPLHSDLKEILTAARRSADITRQLLGFARQQTIAPRVLDLNDTVESMLKMLRRLIGEDIDLSWNPRAGLGLVKMDPTQIDQVLANLCVNARDAINNIGKIIIETAAVTFDEEYCVDHEGFIPGNFVMLAVSDDGVGMDREILNKVFEPFFTTKKVGQGTGLGLATVYGIVKQNDGFINVYSEPGKGTTFKIYLPESSDQAAGDDTLNGECSIPNGSGETVLVVEDDALILKVTEKMLSSLGYKVLQAKRPTEAMQLAEKQSSGDISLLLTDVVMPGMDGLELSKKLEALYPKLKYLFMSGYTAEVIAHRGILEEGVNFIQKPFSRKDLATKVREVLHSSKRT